MRGAIGARLPTFSAKDACVHVCGVVTGVNIIESIDKV